MGNKPWKDAERRVAKVFIGRGFPNAHRNPLSGANNITDDSKPRCGDVIGTPYLIEVKHSANLFNKIFKYFKKTKTKTIFYDDRFALMKIEDLMFNAIDPSAPEPRQYDIHSILSKKMVLMPIKLPKSIYKWFDKSIAESGGKPVMLFLHPKRKAQFYVVVERSFIGWKLGV
ncbi:MAG: hypothetical protein MUP55_01515 [Candidatus Aenigmarchaeota archaeon]|nr:hypothetical protein [Candidatus Aenigmarchaeota archaeon]